MAPSRMDGSLGMNVCMESINQGVNVIFKLLNRSTRKKKRNLFAEDSDVSGIFLKFELKKMIYTTEKIRKEIQLPHPVFSESRSRVCFFVKDSKRYKDDELHSIDEFKQRLASLSLKNLVSRIIPLYELKTEYFSEQSKRNLACSCDLFLVDEDLKEDVEEFLGEAFTTVKSMPVPVPTHKHKIKQSIAEVFQSTFLLLDGLNTQFDIHIGYVTFEKQNVADNVIAVVKALPELIPGGWINVRSVSLWTPNRLEIPIYYSLGSANDVKLEREVEPNSPIIDELSTLHEGVVHVYPDGTVDVVGAPTWQHPSEDEMEEEARLSDNSDEDDLRLFPVNAQNILGN